MDYGKKKNAELEELLRGRGLPHTGKKAELVARLQQADQTAQTVPDQKPATQTKEIEAKTSIDSKPDQGNEKSTGTEVSKSGFASGLNKTDAADELSKRQSRAARFGIVDAAANKSTNGEDVEALKRLERAKKFGLQTNNVRPLDQALPEKRKHETKSGPPDGKRNRDDGRRGSRANGSSMAEKDRLAAEARKKRFAI